MTMNGYNAYKATTAATVSKTRQVVMLYEGAIKFMRQSIVAIEEGRIEDRFNLCNKVHEILFGLQGALDFDQGGDIATMLYEYYNDLLYLLTNVQQSNSIDDCRQIIDQLQEMADAWRQVDSDMAREKAAQMQSPFSGIGQSMRSGGMDNSALASLLGAAV